MAEKKLSNCEELIMKCIWSSAHELSMQQIKEQASIQFGKEWKTQTVSTFLHKLVQKEYLQMYRKGHCYFYQPLVNGADYAARELEDIYSFWFEGDMEQLVAHATSMMSDEEKQKLKERIKALE